MQSSRKGLSLRALKERIEIASIVIGMTGATVGALFAAFQYLEQVQANRVKATIELVQRFGTPPISQHWDRLEEAWLNVENEFPKHIADQDDWNKFVGDTVEGAKILPDIMSIVEFFKTVEICVENNICDKSSAEAFFLGDATHFVHLHYPVIEKRRDARHDQSLGSETEKFIRNAKKQ